MLCFNDDIQGTAAVALAGVTSSRLTGRSFQDLRIMFLGAGSAATGIADLLISALVNAGLTLPEARARLWFVDVHGLVVKSRRDLMPHNLPYAHEHPLLGFAMPSTHSSRTCSSAQPERRGRSPRPQSSACAYKRAPRAVRAVQSHLKGGMHGRSGLHVEPAARCSPVAVLSVQ